MKKGALVGLGIAALLGCQGNNPETGQSMDAGTIGAYGTTHDNIPEGVVLACGNIARINSHNSVFYACEGDLTPALLEELDLIGQVKEYGRNALGYENTPNYRTYKNEMTEIPLTIFGLYVAPKYVINESPIQIIIETPAEYRTQASHAIRIISLQDNLVDEALFFKSKGYQIFGSFGEGVTSGFSMEETHNPNLGCDLTQELFNYPPYAKIEVILHEDWHYNIIGVWGKNLDLNLEESIATLMGCVAAVDFAIQTYGKTSDITLDTERKLENWLQVSEYINGIYKTLKELYADETRREEAETFNKKIAEETTKELGFEINNASIYRYLPYTLHFPLLYRVYLANPDINVLLNIMRQVPEREAEGVRFLEQYAQELPNSH